MVTPAAAAAAAHKDNGTIERKARLRLWIRLLRAMIRKTRARSGSSSSSRSRSSTPGVDLRRSCGNLGENREANARLCLGDIVGHQVVTRLETSPPIRRSIDACTPTSTWRV